MKNITYGYVFLQMNMSWPRHQTSRTSDEALHLTPEQTQCHTEHHTPRTPELTQ